MSNFIITEFEDFLHPLSFALTTPENLSEFFSHFGYSISLASAASAFPVFGSLITSLDTTETEIGALLDDGLDNIGLEDIEPVVTLIKSVISLISDLDGLSFTDFLPDQMTMNTFNQNIQSFPEEVFDHLIAEYLSGKYPWMLDILNALNVISHERVSDDLRSHSYFRTTFNWDEIGKLFRNPTLWAEDAYGWGTSNFDTDLAINRTSRIFEYIGGLVNTDEMTEDQIAVFLPHLVGQQVAPVLALAPLMRVRGLDSDGRIDPELSGEIGLALFPYVSIDGQTAESGLAVGPYAEGSLGSSFTFRPGMDLDVNSGVDAIGGITFGMTPSGVEFKSSIDNAAYTGNFGAKFIIGPEDSAKKLVLIGSANSTRIQADKFSVKIGGSVSSQTNFDCFFAAGLKNLTAVIDPGDDGLLSSVISDPIEISAGDLALGWRPGRGIYFEGGSNFSIVVPVDLNLGPLNIHEFGLDLDFTSPVTIKITTTADVTIGPLFAYAEGMGISAKITVAPNGDGLLGKHDLNFGFVSPSGYAISLDGGAIKGGGMLSVMEDEYRGALALKFSKFGFSAFGILNTTLPDGEDGFSFAASIFADINVPLSFGFILTGLGGFIGINRTINSQALRDVLYEGRLDNLIFPADPIENAKAILEDMAEIMPAYKGNHLFGPVARIGWGQPVLIDIKLGVIVELGDNVRILILGGLGVALPTKDSAVVELNVTFFGEIDFGAKTISFDATLLNSRILTFAISGDMALRSGWGPRQEHIVSIGGLHPLFPKPSNLPDLRRITIAFGSDNPRITVEAYSALTSNSLQFGARADLYAKGPNLRILGRFAAIGYVYFDALIYFKPFAFDISLGGGLELLRNGNVILNLGFDLRFRGPNTFHIQGKAWATVLKKKIKISINHRFGSAQSVSIETVDPARVLFKALEKSKGFEPFTLPGRTSGVVFTSENEQVTDPLGGIRLSQTAIPLNENIHKVGESALQAGANSVDIVVKNGTSIVSTNPTYSDFVHGHFFRITDAEKLRATAFDSLKSGFEIGSPALIPGNAAPVVEEYSHEYIEIPVHVSSDSFVGHVHTTAGNIPAALAVKLKSLDPAHILTQFSQEGLAHQLTPGHVYERDWVVSDPVTINNDLFVENTAELSADLSSALQGSVGEPQMIRDQLAQSLASHFSAASTQESVTTQTAAERNAYVHDYVALAGQL